LSRDASLVYVEVESSVTKIGPKSSPTGHVFASSFGYFYTIMRRAFVLQLGPETRPAEDAFEGWVQEVDSCTELRFRSTEELLEFLGQRFEQAISSTGKSRTGDCEQAAIRKKRSRKEIKST
jgi:hypothetical protein